MVFFGLPVLAPAIQASFGLSLSQVGAVLTSLNVGALLTTLGWGLLADRVGERAVTGFGLGVAALALAVAAQASSFWSLVAALFVVGAFGAAVLAASGRAVMRWFAPAQRGLALGIRQTAVPVGGALAAVVLPPITDAGGVDMALLTLAGGLLVAAVASALWLRGAPDEAELGTRIADVFRDRRLWRLSSGSSLLLAAQICLLGFVVLFLHQERSLSTAAAAGVLALMQVLGAVLRIAAGHRSDRVRDRIGPLLRLGSLLTLGLVLSAVLLQAPTMLLLPVLVGAGALSLSWNGLSFTAAAELGGTGRAGAALGFQQTSLGVASAVTPIAFAAVVELTSWTVGFSLAAVAALLGTAVIRGLRSSVPLEGIGFGVGDR